MQHISSLRHLWVYVAKTPRAFRVGTGMLLLCAGLIVGFLSPVVSSVAMISFAGVLVIALATYTSKALLERRYAHVADRITSVVAHLSLSMYANEWFGYNPSDDKIDDSRGEDISAALNSMLDTMSRRMEIERGLRSFTGVLSQHIDLAELSTASLDKLLALTGAEAGAIFLDRDGHLATLASSCLSDPERILTFSGVEDALRTGKMTRFDHDESSGLSITRADGGASLRIRELIVGPLMLKDQSLGLVVLVSSTSLKYHVVSLFDLLRVSLGFALTHADAREKMQTLATYDALTSVYNRRFGLERFRQEYSRSIRTGRPIGVLMLDIDHFKWINDTHGHLAGDEVLRAVTGVFRRSIREADVLLRYGGEEFLVVLPDADIEAVVTVGERLRAAVEKASVSHEGKSISLTVSIGATAYIVGQTDSEEQMLAEADAAMYAAKNSGRDRLCAYRTRSGECVPASAIVGVA